MFGYGSKPDLFLSLDSGVAKEKYLQYKDKVQGGYLKSIIPYSVYKLFHDFDQMRLIKLKAVKCVLHEMRKEDFDHIFDKLYKNAVNTDIISIEKENIFI